MFKLTRTYGGAFASGILLACSFPALHWFPLAWIGIAPLGFGTADRRPVQTGLHFFLSGWVFHLIVLQWLCANIFWAGGWALIGHQLLAIYLSLFWGIAGWIWACIRARNDRIGGATLLALIWVAMEWCQSWLFTGFGWTALGYTQGPDAQVRQWAALGGVSAISFLLVLTGALIGLALAEPYGRRARMAAAVAVVGVAHLVGVLLPGFTERIYSPYRVGLFQSNYPQTMKWDWEFREDMVRRAAERSEIMERMDGPVDLFVWPEALVMDHGEDPDLLRYMSALTQTSGTPLFTGTERHEAGVVYNSGMLVGVDGEIEAWYDKIHLAPFGEYAPFERYLPFLRAIVPGAGLGAGEAPQILAAGEKKFGPLICFEVLFGPMAEWYRREGADFLVVITNLGWFGASNGIAQELEIARMRAIETRLPLVHCANTGISGVIDPLGNFTPVNAVMTAGGLYGKLRDEPTDVQSLIMVRRMGVLTVPMYPAGRLPYGAQMLPWLALAASLGAAAWAFARPGEPGSGHAATAPGSIGSRKAGAEGTEPRRPPRDSAEPHDDVMI